MKQCNASMGDTLPQNTKPPSCRICGEKKKKEIKKVTETDISLVLS